jgi:hypothetical protein
MTFSRKIVPFVVVFFAMAMLIAGLVWGSSYNPTPTNTNSSGQGSGYPGFHHAASYSKPLFTEGPDGS